MESLRNLILGGADVNAKTDAGQTALMFAAYGGHAEVTGQLLEAGADVNAKSNDGQTALVLAVNMGRSEIVSLLQAAGAVL